MPAPVNGRLSKAARDSLRRDGDIKTAPMIVGGVYEKLDITSGQKITGVLLGKAPRSDGLYEGTIFVHGLQNERVLEGTLDYARWTLIAVPKTLDEPISADNSPQAMEVEAAAIKKRLEALKASGVKV